MADLDPSVSLDAHFVLDTTVAANWYAKHFGDKVTRMGSFDVIAYGDLVISLKGIRYRDNWLLVSQSRKQRLPIAGTSIDHLGWRSENLDELAAKLKSK